MIDALFAAIPFPDIDPAVFTIPRFPLFGFEIGPLALRWYALAYITGLLIGWKYMSALAANNALWTPAQARPNKDQTDDFLFWATLGVILGGRLGYVLFYRPDIIWTNPVEIFAIWHGGMSFHGAVLALTFVVWWFAKQNKLSFFTVGDLLCAAAPFGLFFGRIANFINAELYGRATDAPWGVIFPGQSFARHPSQLYEAILEGIVLFIILRVATHQNKSLQRPGLTAGIFLLGYGLFRFAVEFVREPDAHMPEALRGYITMGMILCLPMILGGLWLIQRARHRPIAA
jgi:phosphatidylglycerol:prolipoprotein diacylglycerol transferase